MPACGVFWGVFLEVTMGCINDVSVCSSGGHDEDVLIVSVCSFGGHHDDVVMMFRFVLLGS